MAKLEAKVACIVEGCLRRPNRGGWCVPSKQVVVATEW